MSNSAICLIEKKAVRERDGKSLRACSKSASGLHFHLPLSTQCAPL